MPNRDLHNMRESYESAFLLEEDCDKDPFAQFEKWFHLATAANVYEPNAMTIATVGKDGQPSARMVLLKSFDHDGFVFFSNYASRKGIQMSDNEKVALLFWWGSLERQVRIEGVVHRTPEVLNDVYFHSRPRESQLAALISSQSSVIESREVLDNLYTAKENELADKDIPLKENWGGYLVTPTLFEFWQGRKSRLHDRIQYTKEDAVNWKMERLAP